MAALKAVCGDRFMEVAMKAKSQVTDKSDVKVGSGKLSLRLRTAKDDMKTALAFLAEQGFKVERMVIADHMPELKSLSKLDADKAAVYSAEMKKCAFWKMTVSEDEGKVDTSDVGSKDFDVSAELRDGTMSLTVRGRLDTITAPNLLDFYERNKDQIQGVNVNCHDLDYISSAGLRVLVIMLKDCENGVTITEVNDSVRDILEQTGLDQILTIV
jgi:anti-anti-sigma factor